MKTKRQEEVSKIVHESQRLFTSRAIQYIKSITAHHLGQASDVYENTTRSAHIVKTKHIAKYLIMKNVEIGPSELAKEFKQHHSSVIHSVNLVKNLMEVDKEWRTLVDEIQKMISLKTQSVETPFGTKDGLYYIDLDQVVSFKISDKKAVIYAGFSPHELIKIKEQSFDSVEMRKHKRTGLFILEQLKDNEEKM